MSVASQIALTELTQTSQTWLYNTKSGEDGEFWGMQAFFVVQCGERNMALVGTLGT